MSLTADVAATLQPGFVGTTVPDWVAEAHAEGLTSVCLYGDNISPDGGLAPVCADANRRLPGILLATDEEGGDVTRVHYPAGSTTWRRRGRLLVASGPSSSTSASGSTSRRAST